MHKSLTNILGKWKWQINVAVVTVSVITAASAQAADVSIIDYGAVSSASANNLSAIQSAINAAAKAGANVYVPPGVYGYAGVIRLPGPVKFYGAGASSELRSFDPYNETIMVTGDGAKVSKLKLTMAPNSVGRQDPLECQRVTLNKATNFEVSDLTIQGSSAAGIMSWGGQHGVITRNRISNTLADSIHMTLGSAYIEVTNNEISGSGDDGVAVVSYQRDGALSHDVTASNNVIYANTWGRGMTVVGGSNVTYTNNYVHDVPGASCFYIAQENYYVTYPSSNVVLKNNTAENCGGGGGNHGGFLIWGDGQENTNIKLESNLIIQPAGSGKPGISVTSLNRNVSLLNNKLVNANVYIQTASQVMQNSAYSSGTVGYVEPSGASSAPPSPAPSSPLSVSVLPATPGWIRSSPGRAFRITYSFRSGSPGPKMNMSLMVFVHFVDANGRIAFQDDHAPIVATTEWSGLMNETRWVRVPTWAPRQTYTIRIGLYDPSTGERVELEPTSGVSNDGENRYVIGTLKVP